MRERRRILLMMAIMVSACLAASAVAISVLYRAELMERQARLHDTVVLQARLIEAVGRYDASTVDALRQNNPDFDSSAATLSQIADAFENYAGYDHTGEFILGRRNDDVIDFVVRSHVGMVDQAESLDFNSDRVKPMRRALNGQSGVLKGFDYRGKMVIAAYEPVSVLNLGLVGTVTLSEIRSEFVPASVLAILASLFVTALSTFAFGRVSRPMTEKLAQHARSLERQLKKQRKAEENLIQAQLMLESSLKSAKGMIIFAIDTEYRYLYFNEAHRFTMKQVYGSEIAEGKYILDCISRESDRLKVTGYYERVLAGESFTVVEKFGDEKRPYFELLFTPIRNDADDILGVTVFAQDISKRKSAEDELHQSLKRFSTLANLTPVGIFETDKKGKCIYANVFWLRMTGMRLQQALGDGWIQCLHPDDRSRVSEQWSEAVASQEKWESEYRFMTPAGGIIWAYGVAETLREDTGEVTGYISAIMDITERKKNDQERRSLERQMLQAQKLESLGILAGGIAHDFNNLLMTILGNADIAQQDLAPHAPAQSSIKSIVTAAHRAADLSKQMLAYSGKGRFVIEPIDLNTFIQEMAHLLDVSISKKAFLKYNFASDIPPLKGDVTQVRQVIMNLIINSSEAIGDNHGVVSISTGTQDCNHEYLDDPGNPSLSGLDENLPRGKYVYLEVTDTGCGMDLETKEKLFDPFFTTKFTGRGLGMAAILGIVRGHHGLIRVYTEVGKGTTIKVLFPSIEQVAAVVGNVTETETEANWHRKGTVLIADDEEDVCTITRRYLERMGFDVLTAADGQQAIDIFRQQSKSIVCVLLDMTMPHVDGKEAFQEIRKIRKDAKVILCSGYNEQDATQHFVGKGLAGFLQKPYRSAELKTKLIEVLT